MTTKPILPRQLILLMLLAAASISAFAGDLDTMGVTLLRAQDATLTGGGIVVAQSEAEVGPNAWEVTPSTTGQPTLLFTWINTNGSSDDFPNSLGADSPHSDAVASNFYGSTAGIAPGVLHVDNSDADYFVQYVVAQPGLPISDRVINQSFIFIFDTSNGPIAVQQAQEDLIYDTYIDTNGGLFCSGVGNGGPPSAPATAYNGIGVGAYGLGASSSVGPTPDNGRSKPDLVAPAQETSFSTPYVSGAAAVLLQAAARGDGGVNTNAAGDIRTVKALLLNGALKPGDWNHTTNAPLDTRYGAGLLNLYYSHQQLAAGQQPLSASQLVAQGGPHPPLTPANLVNSLLGWDFQTITSGVTNDCVNHYYFDNSANPANLLTLTATLVWNRAANETNINNLALFLYDSSSGNLAAASVSAVDNVQHVYIPNLPRGQYDLQVVKYGGAGEISPSENYALAFQFYPVAAPSLNVALSGTNVVISWPGTPTIFNLDQSASLAPPISWSPVGVVGFLTNGNVYVTLSPLAADSFYQLSR